MSGVVGQSENLASGRDGLENSILRQRLHFQQVICELSNHFINLPEEEIDQHINEALRKLASFLGFNGAAISKFASYGRRGEVGHIWTATEVPAIRGQFTEKDFPWSAERLLEGKDVMLPAMDALPPLASVDRVTYERLDVKSCYSKVLRSGKSIVGVLALVSFGGTREFPEEWKGEIDLFAQVLASALARQRAATAISEALAFERMLTDFSRRLLAAAPSETGDELERELRALADFFGVDRCTFWELSADQRWFRILHSYHDQSDVIPDTVESSSMPWFMQELTAGRPICLERLSDLPTTATDERGYWLEHKLQSALLVPLVAMGSLAGCFSLAAFKAERQWPPDLVRRLQLAGELFTNAILRKQAHEAMQKSEERLALAADSAGAGLWSLELKTLRFWMTDKARELFQLPQYALVTFELFLSKVHPDDRDLIQRTLRELEMSKEQFRLDYRILPAVGELRWVAATGRVRFDASKRPLYVMGVTVDITDRKRSEEVLRSSLAQVQQLKDRLQAETAYLREEIRVTQSHGEVVGDSPAIRKVLHRVEQVAPTDSSVLIRGETGTGKELIANAIHRASPRKERVMVMVNCAALPAALVESELFGRERGAYTGALTRQPGRFEVADNSTLFLDEIGEISLELQAKLLRVLETGQFERLGSNKTIKVNVRLVAATNRNLTKAVAEEKFREDLFYRLNVFPISIPPLRERLEDIPELVWFFVQQFATRMGKKINRIPRKAMEVLQHYQWPGNVRELRNVIEHSVIITSGDTLNLAMPEGLPAVVSSTTPLSDHERHHILRTLELTRWRIKGSTGAAAKLGLKPSTLYTRMKKLEIPTRREKLGV